MKQVLPPKPKRRLSLPTPIRVGMKVVVNSYLIGRVKDIVAETQDFMGNIVPLKNPLYTIAVQTDKRIAQRKSTTKVFVPKPKEGENIVILKLFEDEFTLY